MSKWNRPMRAFQPARLVCETCGQGVKMTDLGAWVHIREAKRLVDWHLAKVAA